MAAWESEYIERTALEGMILRRSSAEARVEGKVSLIVLSVV